MGINSDNSICDPGEQPADRLLADRFALPKGCVLTHVAEIGRQQDDPLAAATPQRLGCEQQRDEFVIGVIERSVDDGSRGSRTYRHSNFPIGK